MIERTRSGQSPHGARRCIRRPAALAAAAGALLATVAGCSDTPAQPPPAPPPVSSVPLPAPYEDGPVLTVEGQAFWLTEHPGCSKLVVGAQEFSLTGPAAARRLGEFRAHRLPAEQAVRVSGYVPKVGASVCPARRAFVAEKVDTVDR